MCRMSWKSGSLNLLEPSGVHRACYGTPELIMISYTQPSSRLSVDWSPYISNTKMCQHSVNELGGQFAIQQSRCTATDHSLWRDVSAVMLVAVPSGKIYISLFIQNTQTIVQVEGYHRLRPVLSHRRLHKGLSRTSNQHNPSFTPISQTCLGRMPRIIHHFLSEGKMTC